MNNPFTRMFGVETRSEVMQKMATWRDTIEDLLENDTFFQRDEMELVMMSGILKDMINALETQTWE